MDGTQKPPDGRTAADLLSQLAGDLTGLVRKEAELVRTELTEKVRTGGKAVGEIAAGALLMVAALLVLLQAVVLGLSKFMDPAWAALLVGGVVAIVGYVALRGGMRMLKPGALTPDRSARQLQKDAQLMKGRRHEVVS
jgi:hypothetical protein